MLASDSTVFETAISKVEDTKGVDKAQDETVEIAPAEELVANISTEVTGISAMGACVKVRVGVELIVGPVVILVRLAIAQF